MRECKDICIRLEKATFEFGKKLYQNGIKYCSICCIRINFNGYRCVCCGTNLRSKSHTKRWKIQQIRGRIN